jgi:hypothetical protein
VPKNRHAAYDRTIRGRYRHARQGAARRGLEFNITLEAFEWMHQQPCHWCGAPLAETGSGLDRLDNNAGYVPGNVVQACDVCNLLRGRRFRPDLMAVIGAVVKYARAHDPDGIYPDGRERQ